MIYLTETVVFSFWGIMWYTGIPAQRKYWPFVRGIHRSPVNYPHKANDAHGALMLSLICAWTNGWANNRDAGNLRQHPAHYDVTVMEHRNLWHLCISGFSVQQLTIVVNSQYMRHLVQHQQLHVIDEVGGLNDSVGHGPACRQLKSRGQSRLSLLPKAVRLMPGRRQPGACLNIKTIFPRYGDSHVKDKTVVRPSYL